MCATCNVEKNVGRRQSEIIKKNLREIEVVVLTGMYQSDFKATCRFQGVIKRRRLS